RALLGNAVADERANDRADASARRRTRECRGERAHRDDRQPWHGDTRRREAREQRAEATAGHRADAGALRGARAEVRLVDLVLREIAIAAVTGHEQAHIIRRVTALGQRPVGTFG